MKYLLFIILSLVLVGNTALARSQAKDRAIEIINTAFWQNMQTVVSEEKGITVQDIEDELTRAREKRTKSYRCATESIFYKYNKKEALRGDQYMRAAIEKNYYVCNEFNPDNIAKEKMAAQVLMIGVNMTGITDNDKVLEITNLILQRAKSYYDIYKDIKEY